MAANQKQTAQTEKKLLDFVAKFTKDPLGFCKVMYPWGQGELQGSTGPRKWQADILDTIGKHLRNPQTRFQPIQIAISSGHGIGKSSLISMINQWALSTCVDTKILITANTDTQLRTKTMPEVNKWNRLALNAHWFKATATAIASIDPARERTWRADAVPWSEENTEAFQGLHNKGRRIVLIFDESSAISDKIWEVAEGAMTDADTEIIWLAFGNPTRNTGRFRACFGRFKHRWTTRQIDSRTVEGTNLEAFEKFIEDYGEDSDFVRVRIRGEFPRAGTQQFIPNDLVDEAIKREPSSTLMDPLILGVDCARSLEEDQTVLAVRRGRDARSIPWMKFRTRDMMVIADSVVKMQTMYHFDAIFIDGGSIGGGVIDYLRRLGYNNVIEVQFAAAADKSVQTGDGVLAYANKRAEMWGAMRDWLRGGAIPDDPDLVTALTSVSYMSDKVLNKKEVILLEKKSDMKKKGLSSPDLADALSVTFFAPIVPRDHSADFGPGAGRGQNQVQVDYDPLGRDRVIPNEPTQGGPRDRTFYGGH